MIKPQLIENPKGLDLIIQEFQVYLQNNLTEIDSIFGRCYKTKTEKGFIPEVYAGGGEYFDVFASDKVDSHLFFDVSDTQDVSENYNTKFYDKSANVRMIVSAKLDKIYDVFHRADEDLITAIEDVIIEYTAENVKWNYIKILKKTANVFSNYSYELSDNLNDMQPFFVCAFEFNVVYSVKNKYYANC